MRRFSLRTKLVLSYLLVLIIPLALFFSFSVNISRAFVYENANNAIANMVEGARDVYTLKISQLESMLSMCAFNEDLQRIYRNEYDSRYDLYLALKNTAKPFLTGVYGYCLGEVDTLCLYSAQGLLKNGKHIDSIDAVRDEPWVAQALSRGGIQWVVEADAVYALCRVDSVYTTKQSTLGVLRCTLDVDNLLDSILKIGWEAYQVDILTSHGETALSRRYGQESLFAAGPDAMLTFSFAWPESGWSFVYQVPAASITGSYTTLYRTNLLIISLSIAALALLIYVLTRVLLSGIHTLRDKMLLVQGGALDVEVGRPGRDEIGVLTHTFSMMLDNIRSLMDTMRQTEQRAGELELRALRAQIDPHFLYNTLSHINWMAIRSGQEDISAIVRQLSAFYRTCLNEGRQLIGVTQELLNVQAYLAIQRVLHRDSFDVEVDMDPRARDCKMLSFLLQPLAENAIVHGIERKVEGRGRILLRVAVVGEALLFSVEDNGPGMRDDAQGEAIPHKGYGVENVAARIQLYYGEAWRITLANGSDGGCVATVSLPYARCRDA